MRTKNTVTKRPKKGRPVRRSRPEKQSDVDIKEAVRRAALILHRHEARDFFVAAIGGGGPSSFITEGKQIERLLNDTLRIIHENDPEAMVMVFARLLGNVHNWYLVKKPEQWIQ